MSSDPLAAGRRAAPSLEQTGPNGELMARAELGYLDQTDTASSELDRCGPRRHGDTPVRGWIVMQAATSAVTLCLGIR